jgi:hypothetical protein
LSSFFTVLAAFIASLSESGVNLISRPPPSSGTASLAFFPSRVPVQPLGIEQLVRAEIQAHRQGRRCGLVGFADHALALDRERHLEEARAAGRFHLVITGRDAHEFGFLRAVQLQDGMLARRHDVAREMHKPLTALAAFQRFSHQRRIGDQFIEGRGIFHLVNTEDQRVGLAAVFIEPVVGLDLHQDGVAPELPGDFGHGFLARVAAHQGIGRGAARQGRRRHAGGQAGASHPPCTHPLGPLFNQVLPCS